MTESVTEAETVTESESVAVTVAETVTVTVTETVVRGYRACDTDPIFLPSMYLL